MNGSALAFFARTFYGEKENIATYIPHRKKIAEEETGLEPDRVHARHLHLRHTP